MECIGQSVNQRAKRGTLRAFLLNNFFVPAAWLAQSVEHANLKQLTQTETSQGCGFTEQETKRQHSASFVTVTVVHKLDQLQSVCPRWSSG